ncbi:cation:proton antiporter [Lacticaseibacillus paracasei subsp. paracasei]|nr:Na(+)/H(+) antiporter [Lacticaseibacillus casei 21/1]QWA32710.1 cation:proton antiporter [Lacticaseibacillus paracasei subsp. paracasei]
MQDIGNLALILVTTLVLAHLSRLLNMPAVIGELLAGILIGPALLGWLAPSHTISLFAEIGVIILMFLAGLESDLDLLKNTSNQACWSP